MPFACWRMCVCICFGSWPHVCTVPMNKWMKNLLFKPERSPTCRQKICLKFIAVNFLNIASEFWGLTHEPIEHDIFVGEVSCAIEDTSQHDFVDKHESVSTYVLFWNQGIQTLLETRTNGRCTFWELSNVRNQSTSEFEIRENARENKEQATFASSSSRSVCL